MTSPRLSSALVLASLLATACSSMKAAPMSPSSSARGGAASPGMAAAPSMAMDASPASATSPAPPSATSAARESAKKEAEVAAARPQGPSAGVLTVGVWDDNRNFDFFQPYLQGHEPAGQASALFSLDDRRWARERQAQGQRAHTELDVELVIDTTGSMGDELRYLQTEFDAIASQLRTRFPQVTPRWSLVLYRDHSDEYLTRPFGFTSDTSTFRRQLAAQSADGGGDFPEAVIDGLKDGLEQAWRPGAQVSRVMFWMADAPTHDGEERTLANLVRQAQRMDVRIYPIAASGIDDKAEYQMRSAAQFTGGRYIFLTDDSGVGGSHAEPHIPCYSVTRLDHAIVRVLETELSGRPAGLPQEQIVRQVGQPDPSGHCKLSSGKEVASF